MTILFTAAECVLELRLGQLQKYFETSVCVLLLTTQALWIEFMKDATEGLLGE